MEFSLELSVLKITIIFSCQFFHSSSYCTKFRWNSLKTIQMQKNKEEKWRGKKDDTETNLIYQVIKFVLCEMQRFNLELELTPRGHFISPYVNIHELHTRLRQNVHKSPCIPIQKCIVIHTIHICALFIVYVSSWMAPGLTHLNIIIEIMNCSYRQR